MIPIPETDLILNPDGSIYHLNLLPEDVAPIIITVGDPDRVSDISNRFDSIELKKGKREFITHTGYVGRKRVSVISTGIGTDNIDIVINELDALVNLDFGMRMPKTELISLDIIRIGTSGTIQPDIEIDSILFSEYAFGFDSLMHYYFHTLEGDERMMQDHIHSYFHHINNIKPYVTSASTTLMDKFGNSHLKGITATIPGFYAPQGRELRGRTTIPDFVQLLNTFDFNDLKITNLEMETAGIYGLAKVLGHKAISVNAILANRTTMKFSKDPLKVISKAIDHILINL